MGKLNWKVKLSALLILVSASIYLIIYLIFHKPETELFYIGIDLAFVPLEILIVVIVVEAAISSRELAERLEKLNMVIGAFFSELGTEFLREVSGYESMSGRIASMLRIDTSWESRDFRELGSRIADMEFRFKLGSPETIKLMEYLKEFLISRRGFLLGLLENPNLLEHESFTDMLWAVFHLMEELEARDDLLGLPDTDYQHLAGDLTRAYSGVVSEWVRYMEHLSENYPYLFSLAVRKNPFNPRVKVEITE
ncbi:hypothetical protein [Methanothermobacter wolfeii]|uniref:Uncharacterized protein n=1 Tax=Methanothermobacter wolfeii TaxID=145261 RepID=A0A9E7RU82_METWO|nr:hypothetical protein [Methanothermobacter wolfeii]MDI6702464.1 hypothetical protein [Methanothermobacter wolfeii]MDI6841901.1 hypothetical protein [Methanothermobacter wolfeii]UXH32268.1 hypothetical protein N5910_02975 [Methanothermobacter wolfeii]